MYHRYHKNQLFNISPRVGPSWTLLITLNTTVMEGEIVVLRCIILNDDPDAYLLWIKSDSGSTNVIVLTVNETFIQS